MSQHSRTSAALGIDEASRLTGVPESTLRLHVDGGRVPGSLRLPTGRRLIPREALLAYLAERGLPSRHLEDIERRRSRRAWTAPLPVRLGIRHPRSGRTLGTGMGTLVEISVTGMSLKALNWKSCLPGPRTPVAFRVLGGALKGSQGVGRLRWFRLGERQDLRMGMKCLGTPETRRRWRAFVAGAR